ncbi:YxeA family protein [Staphylococcus simulans]|uniref:YxeA family protein n=1 Tax=Staphylococcus simulans TaxID=1286 RepID=UPI00399C06FF
MNKKSLFIVTVIVFFAIVAVSIVRNEYTDRFNPFMTMEKSYAKVEKGTQRYENVQAYSKDGERLPYKLTFLGFDSKREYVVILHKGKYVKEIHYLDALPNSIKE